MWCVVFGGDSNCGGGSYGDRGGSGGDNDGDVI